MDGPVLVTGLGLMGASLAAALSAAGYRVLLHARRASSIEAAVHRGWGRAADDLEAAAADAAIAVVALPVPCIGDSVRRLAVAGAGLVTDLGSTKGSLTEELSELAAAGRYLGSHPMCGSHLQGLDHADPALYQGARVVLTPHPRTPAAALECLVALWTSVGAEPLTMSAAEHDRAVATASHLPHVLAAAAAARLGDGALPLAASGFRDTTRVAAGDPELWADILLENRSAVGESLAASESDLADLRQALGRGERSAVIAWLERGRAKRQAFDERSGDRPCPPA